MAKDKVENKFITKKSEDLSAWYTDIVLKGELADYSPVRGCQVYRPYGMAVWERIKGCLDARIKSSGIAGKLHEEAYYPIFIPKSLMMKEAEHVEGFAPECAWVTIGGGKVLDDPLAVRPTSEVIIGVMWSKWITSYRDLPVLHNQWANVVRWEKATRPFLRTLEFLWQEGHTAHSTEAEAVEETLNILDMYTTFAREDLSLAVLPGRKSDSEKFAGAVATYAIEAMMPDGKALQSGTSHFLGQNFSKTYDIKFQGEDGQEHFCYTASWGISHRIMGGMLMAHGDDNGMIHPPKVAPIQVVIVPIFKDDNREQIISAARVLELSLKSIKVFDQPLRVILDLSEDTPGFKYSKWELKGVPFRFELGPKDLQNKTALMVSRLDRKKDFVPFDLENGINPEKVVENIINLQKELLTSSNTQLSDKIHVCTTEKQLQEVLNSNAGFALAPWDGSAEMEAIIKRDYGATVRVIADKNNPVLSVKLNEFTKDANLISLGTGRAATGWVVLAASY